MLFGGTELVSRVELAECGLCAEATRHAATRGVAVLVMPLAGGVATWAGPGGPFNKVVGLGFAGPLDDGALDAAERAYAERGAPVRVELSSLAEPMIAPLLSRRGYVLRGFEGVLGRRLTSDPLSRTRFDGLVREARPDEAQTWLDTVVEGFAHPDEQGVSSDESFPRDALELAIDDMAASGGFVRYLAWRDGKLAGGAGLRMAGEVAQLCGAATLPAHRRRGVQSALLAARLAAAGERCELATVTTQPGSRSQENVQRQGFELLYTRAVLVKPAP